MEAIVAIFIAIILLSGQGHGSEREVERDYSASNTATMEVSNGE